jgi:acetyl-CoA carboxylase biotin carboxyl carrier protein
MTTDLELLARRDGDATLLCSPGVGLFTEPLAPGALLGPGQDGGALLAAGRAARLLVPAGVQGRVVSALPDRVQAPVAYGEVLYRLEPVAAGGDEAADEVASAGGGLVLPSPQTGRFYRRPSPDEPAYAEEGSELTDGAPVGLLEVMKTFSQVHYQAKGGLPARARLARWLVEDGAEVRTGDPLLELEP